jgi:hypothetical protein
MRPTWRRLVKVGELVHIRCVIPSGARNWFFGLILDAKCWNDFVTVYCEGAIFNSKRNDVRRLTGRGMRKHMKKLGL